MIFLRVLPKICLWPHYSGPHELRGPRFIEPPEPPVPTPLLSSDVKQGQTAEGDVMQVFEAKVETGHM